MSDRQGGWLLMCACALLVLALVAILVGSEISDVVDQLRELPRR